MIEVMIPNPPAKLTIGRKTHYLTAQIFYKGVHPRVRMEIVKAAKSVLWPSFRALPRMGPIRISLTVQRPNQAWDLDNKGYFWIKMAQDLLRDLGKVPDDSVKYIRGLAWHPALGPEALIFQFHQE